MASIFLPFITVALAELLDKSQLTLLLLSSKTKKHIQILLGALLAFAIVDGVAILFGSFIAGIIPPIVIKYVAAAVFIFFGIQTVRSQRNNDKNEKLQQMKRPFFTSLSLIFLAEWGDKTQLASGAFSGLFPPISVFIGVMLAMTLLSIIAIFAGKYILQRVPERPLHIIAGSAYILVGGSFLLF